MLNLMPDNAAPGNTTSMPPFPPRRPVSSVEPQRPHINVPGSLRRHWVVALCVFLSFLALGTLALWKRARPIYESHSVVYISPKFPKMLSTDSEVELPYDSYVQDQIQTVSRYDIIADAIAKLPYSVRHQTGPAQPSEIQALQQKLEATRVGTSYQMSVALRGPSPDGLADIVNAVTDTYVDRAKNEEFFGLDARLNTLHQERDRLQKEIDTHMAEQAQLMQQLGVAMIPTAEGATNPFDESSDKLRDQLANARMERGAAEAKLAAFKQGGSGGSTAMDSAAEEAVASDNGTSMMRSQLNTRRAALMEEMNGLRPDHPIYQKDKQELASIEGMMNDLKHKAAVGVEDKLRQDVSRARMVELQLAQELGEKTHSATSAAPKFQKASELGPEIENLQKAFDAIGDRIRDLELESSSPGSIHVSTKALAPLGPEKSRLLFYLAALILLSLACATAAPVGIDLLDGRIYTSQDVERVVGFHPLGILLDDDEFHQEITGEYYFRLAAGIDHAVRNSGARTFLFTSPAHGSGTSTVVRNLSEKLRSLDLRTRTIVASAVEELASSFDGATSRPELLLTSRNKTDEMQPATLSGLATSPNFSGHRRGQDYPAPNPMARAVHHAGEQYDVVLIDANPLPISAHTEYLARVSDATVLVVKSSATTKQELDRAARLLDRLEVAGVAVVLNKMSLSRADSAMKLELDRYEQSFRQRHSTSNGSVHRASTKG